MAIRTTRWKPDTCDCIFEYEWDDSVRPEDRTHVVTKVVKRCDAHVDITHQGNHFIAVLGENRQKNEVVNNIFASMPELTKEIVTPKGDKITVLRDDVKISFDEYRQLQVVVESGNTKELTDLAALCSSKLGAGVIAVR